MPDGGAHFKRHAVTSMTPLTKTRRAGEEIPRRRGSGGAADFAGDPRDRRRRGFVGFPPRLGFATKR
jgi:hypothetical protein